MVNEIHLAPVRLAEARKRRGYPPTPPPVSIAPRNLDDARNRVAARRGQPVVPAIVIDSNALSRAKREMGFRKVEPTPYRQQYLNREILGKSVNSCRIAASIIALVKMGVVKNDPHLLQELETEIVTKGLDTDRYNTNTGQFRFPIIIDIFNNFRLENGYPTTHWYAVREPERGSLAVLKAGGCVIAGIADHTYCLTDLSVDEKSVKYFDPLTNFSSTSDLSNLIQRVQFLSDNPDIRAVYPRGYNREMNRNEGLFVGNYNTPFYIDVSKYLTQRPR